MADETKHDASDLTVLGTQLSDRILDAQARFAAIRKKCDHHVIERLDGCVPKEMLGAHRQGVGFKKNGKEWKLYFVEEGEFEREPSEIEVMIGRYESAFSPRPRKVRQYYLSWDELSKASLIEKSKAVKMLPRLFNEMQAEYDRRTTLVGEALKVLDKLDSQLPTVKEGE